MSTNLYDVTGVDHPLRLSAEHAEAIGATPHKIVDRPAGNARKAEWINYAIARGVDPEAAEGMTVDELKAIGS